MNEIYPLDSRGGRSVGRRRAIFSQIVLWSSCGFLLLGGCAKFSRLSADGAGGKLASVLREKLGRESMVDRMNQTEFPRGLEIVPLADSPIRPGEFNPPGPLPLAPPMGGWDAPVGPLPEFIQPLGVVGTTGMAPEQGHEEYPVSPAGYQAPATPQAPAPTIYQSSPRREVPPADTPYRADWGGPYRSAWGGPSRRMQDEQYRLMQDEQYRQTQNAQNRQTQDAQYRQTQDAQYRQTQDAQNRQTQDAQYRQTEAGQIRPVAADPNRLPQGQMVHPTSNLDRRMVADPPLQNGVVQMEIGSRAIMNGMGLNGSTLGRRGQTATELAIQLRYENGILHDKNEDLVQKISEMDKEIATQKEALEHFSRVIEESNRTNESQRGMIAKLRVEIQDLDKEKREIELHADQALKAIETSLNSMLMNKISPIQDSGSATGGQ